MHHFRKTMKKYISRKSYDCPFCKPETLAEAIYQDDHVYVVPNITKYDLWELHDVEEHLLLVPKRHVEDLASLDSKERLAVMDVMAKYEVKGFNAYARGVGFVKRSVKHQHTHLIKASNKRPRASIYIKKPYFLIRW